MSKQYWQELLAWVETNAAAIANTTTETILFPDVTIPAFYMNDGRILRLTAMGKLSNIVTSPGNLNFAIRWGGVSGTILAQSSAIALNATAQTDIMFRLTAEIFCRAFGSSGSLLAMGKVEIATPATQAPYLLGSAGGLTGNTPAPVTVDTTTNQALSLTAKFSVANAGNTITGMNYLLEALN